MAQVLCSVNFALLLIFFLSNFCQYSMGFTQSYLMEILLDRTIGDSVKE